MFKILLALHIVFAVFAIGPLVQVATTAGRGVRRGDAAATSAATRLLRWYAYTSLLVVLTGLLLMETDLPFAGEGKAGDFGATWIWLSLVLWAVAIGILLGLVVPTLEKATALIGQQGSVAALTPRVAASGGVVGLMFVAIVFLMVYRPGH